MPTPAELMLGNAAIARGAYEAGLKVASAYPGTPSTEVSENLTRYRDELYCEWAPNEKVALEVAIGASISGVRAMSVMKHVGVNVAADPLFTIAYSGVGGGLVLIVADDPGIYSSQNEQDTRLVARAAMVPVIEPSDSEEARVFTKRAFELSEEYDTPVILRTTTRLSHSQSLVYPEERIEQEIKPYQRNIAKNVMIPINARGRHLAVEARMKRLADDAETVGLHQVTYSDRPMRVKSVDGSGHEELKVGVITSGIAYQYVREALPDASILKLGMVYPLPRRQIEAFATRVDRLYIFEELEPFIEEQVRSWGIPCIGKEIFSIQGEYSIQIIIREILGEQYEYDQPLSVPARPPILCPGCPHRSAFAVMKKLKLHAAGDIGCYTLGALSPLDVIDTCVCMGSSISTLHGMEKGRGRDYMKDWVAVIGDSTFLHTGVNSLMNMVYNQATGTVVILDNATTGMTGHQHHPGTGVNLMGEKAPITDIAALCRSLGVEHVHVIDAFDTDLLEKRLKEEVARQAVSVIIVTSPCVLLKDFVPKGKCAVIADKCRKCGLCIVTTCPAMRKYEDGLVEIDPLVCTGCGHCQKSCKFDAIRKDT
ncbi:MAG: indolepyruvate ferredoxin oxidoreductase subunit alpha [Lachnospiraceae bacterium]|jgi:indolepyruvate ferredoxin oxidoreductase alpha subunit|nr:indolepyruvate ferredoxin oxidoreductase subunit alpha [Lachnospiraceae bacterium]